MSLLSQPELENLARQQADWCVSIYMPTHRTGSEIQQDPIRLKNLLDEAGNRLQEAGLRSPDARQMLEPAYDLVPRQREFWQHQSDGLAIFLSADNFHYYRLPHRFEEFVSVAGRYHLKPLIPLLSEAGHFYILALSQNEIRLLQGSRDSVSEVELKNVPPSLAEALKWDDPERQLQWHTGTSFPAGQYRAAAFHGHGVTNAEQSKDEILRYFQKIDAGLADLLAGERAPLVLAGVEYLFPIYRQANSYRHLIAEGIPGNPDELSAEELHRRAWPIVQPIFKGGQTEAVERYWQTSGNNSRLVSTDLHEIVPAAHFERVEVLFVALGIQQWGTFDADTGDVHLRAEAGPGDFDLLDFAAVHTILNGGAVYAVAPQDVPDTGPAAALFRF
jgi:hypothetical protein